MGLTELTLSIAFIAAFLILSITKLGVREWAQIHAPKLISKLFSCDFCLSFWTCLFISLILLIFTGDIRLLIIPFLATPVTRLVI
jgi:hypothetical protein